MLIKILLENSVSILLFLSKTAKKLDKKIFFLIKTIDIAINVSIFQAILYIKFILRFDKNCKNA